MQTELINCPLCGLKDYKEVLVDYDRITGIVGYFTLVKCNGCGLLYVSPRPSQNELSHFYKNDYFAYFWNKDSDRSESRIKKILSMLYGRLKKSGFCKYFCKIAFNILAKNNGLDLSLAKLDHNSQIIDIGCGTGLFLERIRWFTGCKVKGVEQNDAARNKANKLLDEDAVIANLPDSSFIQESFDLITLWYVFEHLTEPQQTLNKIHSLIKKEGILVIAVPNAQSWSWFIFKKFWTGLDLPRHLMLLTPGTVKKFLTKANFEPIRIKYGNCPHVYLSSMQSIFFKKKMCLKESFFRASVFYLTNIFLFPLGLLEIIFHRSAAIIIYAKKAVK